MKMVKIQHSTDAVTHIDPKNVNNGNGISRANSTKDGAVTFEDLFYP